MMAVDILSDFPSKKCTTCEECVLTVKEKFIIDSDTDEFKRVTAVGCKKSRKCKQAEERKDGNAEVLL